MPLDSLNGCPFGTRWGNKQDGIPSLAEMAFQAWPRCHSEAGRDVIPSLARNLIALRCRFFTPLRSVQNDMCLLDQNDMCPIEQNDVCPLDQNDICVPEGVIRVNCKSVRLRR